MLIIIKLECRFWRGAAQLRVGQFFYWRLSFVPIGLSLCTCNFGSLRPLDGGHHIPFSRLNTTIACLAELMQRLLPPLDVYLLLGW